MDDIGDINELRVKDQLVESQAYQNKLSKDNLQAVVAFYKWRHTQLRAQYRKRVQDVLDEISEEDQAQAELKKRFGDLNNKYSELAAINVRLNVEHRSMQLQLESTDSDAAGLYQACQASEATSRQLEEVLKASKALLEAERRRRDDEQRRHKTESEGLQDQLRAMLVQHQQLVQQMSGRDSQVIELGGEASRATQRVQQLEADVAELRGEVKASCERASAAEQQLKSRSDTVMVLHEELAKFRERYMTETCELKAARVVAADVPRLREQLSTAQDVSASMALARDDLRVSLDSTTAQLLAALERGRRLQAAVGVKEEVAKAVASGPQNGRMVDEVMAAELDAKTQDVVKLAADLAASKAAASHQESHISRLATEAAELQRRLLEDSQQRDHLQRLVGEMRAEMHRLAAQAAAGPIILLSKELQIVRGSADVASAGPAAPTLALSAVETQATALRVAIAERGFGVQALGAALADLLEPPGSKQAGPLARVPTVALQLGLLRSQAQGLVTSLHDVSQGLLVRPLLASGLLGSLKEVRARLGGGVDGLLAVLKGVEGVQVDAVTLDAPLAVAASTLAQASALLGGWSSTMSQLMGQGRSVDEPLRHRVAAELKGVEGALHAALMDLSAATPPHAPGSSPGAHVLSMGGVAAGDAAYIDVELALRAVQNAVMELAVIIVDRDAVSDSRARSHLQHTESLSREKEGVVSRYRESLARVPGALAEMSGKGYSSAEDMVVLVDSIEVMLECLEDYLRCNEQDRTVDPVALQGEVLALRARLRGAERQINEAEGPGEAGAASHSPSRTLRKATAQQLQERGFVPLEALRALEAAHGDAERERAALSAAMAGQRLRHAASRQVFVERWQELRGGALLFACMAAWRGELHASKARSSQVAIEELQSSHEQLVDVCARRRMAVAPTLERLLDQGAQQQALAALRGWRVQAVRQAVLSQRWGLLAVRLSETDLDTRTRLAHPDGATVAQRQARRSQLYRGGTSLSTLIQLRLAGGNAEEEDEDGLTANGRFRERLWALPWSTELALLALRAWRAWARISSSNRHSETLSRSVPLLVSKIGDRRRLERGWLSWRIWLTHRHLMRAEAQLEDQDVLQERLEGVELLLWEEQQQHQAQQEEWQREREQLLQIGRGDGPEAGALVLPLPLPPPTAMFTLSAEERRDSRQEAADMRHPIPVGTSRRTTSQTAADSASVGPSRRMTQTSSRRTSRNDVGNRDKQLPAPPGPVVGNHEHASPPPGGIIVRSAGAADMHPLPDTRQQQQEQQQQLGQPQQQVQRQQLQHGPSLPSWPALNMIARPPAQPLVSYLPASAPQQQQQHTPPLYIPTGLAGFGAGQTGAGGPDGDEGMVLWDPLAGGAAGGGGLAQQDTQPAQRTGQQAPWSGPTFIPHVHTVMATGVQEGGAPNWCPPPRLPSPPAQRQQATNARQQQQQHVHGGGNGPAAKRRAATADAAGRQGRPTQARPGEGRPNWTYAGTSKQAEGARRDPGGQDSLLGRSNELAVAVQRLATGIRDTARSLSLPRRSSAQLAEEQEASRKRTIHLELQLETDSWRPHGQQQQQGVQTSPRRAAAGDSARLSFMPQEQQWQSMARRRIDGSGTEGQAPVMAVTAAPLAATEFVGRESRDQWSPDRRQPAGRLPLTAAQTLYTDDSHSDRPGTIPGGFVHLPGVLDPIRSEPEPLVRTLPPPEPTRQTSAALPLPTTSDLPDRYPPAGAAAEPVERPFGDNNMSGVASRLHHETVSTLAKRRAPGKGGSSAANLVSLPIPPPQPAMAPLSTYVPGELRGSAMGAPMAAQRRPSGTLTQLGPGIGLDAVTAASGAAAATIASLGHMYRAATTDAGAAPPRPFPVVRGEAQVAHVLGSMQPVGLPGCGTGERYGELHGGAGQGPVPSGLRSRLEGPGQQAAAPYQLREMQPASADPGGRLVRFELARPAPPPSRGAGSSGRDVESVTYVNLPEPVRFDISQMK